MSITQAISQDMDARFREKVEPLTEGDLPKVKKSILPLLLPFLMEFLTKLMDNGCGKNNPKIAGRRMKRFGPWTQAQLRLSLKGDENLSEVAPQAFEVLEETSDKYTADQFSQVMEEYQEESIIDHDPFFGGAGFDAAADDEE
jgi:hypothetical protein